MLIGAIAPIPFWLWQRRFPYTRMKFINLPVMLNGPIFAPPANGINYASWFIVGFIFRTYLLSYSCRFLFLSFIRFIGPVGFNYWVGLSGIDEHLERR
jgi:hypothetical protein